MKFKIEYTENIRQQQLLYLVDECSFYTNYINQGIDLELIFNKITLQVLNNEIVDLNGFCGLSKEMSADIKVPSSKKGILKVEYISENGFSYEINEKFDHEYPVYINIETGWVCVGNPNIKKKSVEFINNCIAVINDNGNLASVWLKPKKLPIFI